MATPSAGRGPPHPPPSPRPMSRRYTHSPRSIPRFWPTLRPLPPPPSWPCDRSPPPHAHLPPPQAAKIVCRDKDVSNQTGGVVACRLLAYGSAPCGKCPRSPCAVVRNGICNPLFWQLPQQYHPVHCHPALRHLHARADGPVLEQVECQVQL